MTQPRHAIFLDPSSEHFLGDRLFDMQDSRLNRDGTLLPFARLKARFASMGVPVHTADVLRSGAVLAQTNHYWSLGMRSGYQELLGRDDIRLRGFVLFEPPLVEPAMYADLPNLMQCFENVFVHNVDGDGYALQDAESTKLKKLDWPQPYDSEVEPYWSRRDRENRLVVIAGNHNPKFRHPEFYSKRIQAVGALAALDAVDLYGRGWDRWWSKQSAWWPYWRHFGAIRRAYRGSCEAKLEVLSRYRFSLCFENTPMRGYLTEKLFDCLYAGTVPLYLGAPDIAELVPPDAYVDVRRYSDFRTLFREVNAMPDEAWQRMREAGKEFLRGEGKRRYFDALIDICTLPA
ncbi:MAG TPA: glycosyltransferase family 10 [Rhodocyclaceae bacterium]|nr:glycosyltransferase family 10 [Rhodocyclaceae bacterium]